MQARKPKAASRPSASRLRPAHSSSSTSSAASATASSARAAPPAANGANTPPSDRYASAEDLAAIPEIDFATAKLVRIGPRPGRPMRLSLAQLREVMGKTQRQMADAMDTDQAEVSRLERRSGNVQLATLRRYALAAAHAQIEIIAVLPGGHRIVLTDPSEE